MFFFKGLMKRLSNVTILRDNKRIFLTFLLLSLLFALYMILIEGMTVVDSYYFLITTATTVGYGDFSPKTDLGKLLVTGYMVVGIAIIGILLGKVTDLMVELSHKRKRGIIVMKDNVDLIIAGYPGKEKVRALVEELRNDERMKNSQIVCVNNKLDIKPDWMEQAKVNFIRGIASDSETLSKANLASAKIVLILANDPAKMESDDYSVAVCAVVEQLNTDCRTIVEKVRQDEYIFNIVHADTIVDISSPAILAQEILDPGAIELQNAIFSTHTDGTQFNLTLQAGEKSWSEIALEIIRHNAIPEGFRNPGERTFNLLPHADQIVKNSAVIKYRGKTRLDTLF